MASKSDSVRKLISLLGGSTSPEGVFDWPVVEQSLGLELPADYKQIVEEIPPGYLGGVGAPIRPVVGQDGPELLHFMDAMRLDGIYEERWRDPARIPYPIYPDPQGLLPCIIKPDDTFFFWLTRPSDPSDWPIVVADSRYRQWGLYEGNMSRFFVDILTGSFDVSPYLSGETIRLAQAEDEKPPIAQESDWSQIVRNRPYSNGYFAALKMVTGGSAYVPGQEWPEWEDRLGISFPTDYKFFVDNYGPGRLGDIIISAPGAPGDASLETLLNGIARSADLLYGDAPGEPVYPAPGGLIPWGRTPDNWFCCWAPIDPDPDLWPIVVMPGNGGAYEIFGDLSFVGFLLEYIFPKSTSIFYGREPDSNSPVFVPYRP